MTNEEFSDIMKAAEQGHLDAQFNLANAYYSGDGIPKDMEKAVYWYTKAAEQGHANAQNNLGALYYRGEDVPKDMEKAIYWYTKAAEQGHADAQFNLGCLYSDEGVTQDMEKAIYWVNKAAEQGHANAKFIIAAHEKVRTEVLTGELIKKKSHLFLNTLIRMSNICLHW